MEQQNEFKGWAKVEVMGHQTHIGFVTTQVFGTACLFRVDQPEIPGEERIAGKYEYNRHSERIPEGTKVLVPAIPAASVLIGSASIYRLTPCTEEAARKAILASISRPLIPVGMSEERQLEAPVIDQDDDEDDEDPYEDENCSACGQPLNVCDCPV